MEDINSVLLVIVSVLGGAVLAGAGAWITWGRKMMTRDEHNEVCPHIAEPAITKNGLDKYWDLKAEPIKVEITYLKEGMTELKLGQREVGKKVDRLVRGLLKDEND